MHTKLDDRQQPSATRMLFMSLVGILVISWLVVVVFYIVHTPMVTTAFFMVLASFGGMFMLRVVAKVRSLLLRRVLRGLTYTCMILAVGYALYLVSGSLNELVAHLRQLPG